MPIADAFGPTTSTVSGGDLVLIYSEVLTSDSLDIDTGSLAAFADYKDVRCVLRDIRSDRASTTGVTSGVRMFINNDQTGANYLRAYLEYPTSGSGVTTSSSQSNFISTIPSANETPHNGLQARNGIVVDILSINSSRPKQYMVFSGRTSPSFGGNGDESRAYIRIGSYYGTAEPITRLVFADSNGDDLLAGASLSIYGLK